MLTLQSDRPPTWTKYELEAIKPLREIEELTSLDRDTLVRVYPQYLVRLSPKRLGMKFRNVLKIMNGDAAVWTSASPRRLRTSDTENANHEVTHGPIKRRPRAAVDGIGAKAERQARAVVSAPSRFSAQ
jgi:hypothetical protein